jgi:hypothetical protein
VRVLLAVSPVGQNDRTQYNSPRTALVPEINWGSSQQPQISYTIRI